LWQAAAALYIIGSVALTLLFIGIHNAWDLAVWITVERPEVQQQAESSGPGTSDTQSEGKAGGTAEPGGTRR
jgi:hypothetical protein